jgi:hypothetical protein
LQVVETTTAEGEYVDHKIFVGPGVLPMALGAAAPIAAAHELGSHNLSDVVEINQRVNASPPPIRTHPVEPPVFLPPGHGGSPPGQMK